MVVLTVKNLQHQSFSIDIDTTSTVKELKEKIEKEKGSDYPANGQKLIYAGKILQDASILDTYKIDETKFLVVLVTKPKAAVPTTPSDPVAQAVEALAEQKQEEKEPETTPNTEESEEPAAAAASTTSSSSTSTSTTTTSTTTTTTSDTPAVTPSAGSEGNAESLVVMGEEFNRMVENIMEMGYERPQVERALRASFNNPYTAVTYLVDGIPPNLVDEPSTGGAPGGGGGEVETEGGEAADSDDPLSFLRSQPQFTQMRQMIRSNPQLLDAFIQQIGQTNPGLLEVIQQNQEAFVRMLNEGQPSAGSGGGSTPTSGGGSGGTGGGTGTGGGGGSGGRQGSTIVVSTSDRDAIERLKVLGNFPEDVVIQAYFACEKNENLAAEFLFSQTWD